MTLGREFDGQVAVVSGVGQGIGCAVARALLERGAAVAGLDVQHGSRDELSHVARRANTTYLPLPCDVTQEAEVQEQVDTAEARLGPVTQLACVAGVLVTGTPTTLPLRDWERALAVNATGVFLLCREVSRRMLPRRQGAIVCVASNAGRTPRRDFAAYSASKAAALLFTKCLGLELAPFGIRCNSVSPGSTDTPMQRALWSDESGAERVIAGSLKDHRLGIPLGRLATPEVIAETVIFLLSERSGHTTLQDVCIDGGATLGL